LDRARAEQEGAEDPRDGGEDERRTPRDEGDLGDAAGPGEVGDEAGDERRDDGGRQREEKPPDDPQPAVLLADRVELVLDQEVSAVRRQLAHRRASCVIITEYRTAGVGFRTMQPGSGEGAKYLEQDRI